MLTDELAPPGSSDVPTSLRVLIADDDRFMRTALAAALRTEFEIVAAAADAEEAIAFAAQHRPDAAIVDLDMPAGGGVHATRGIRERSPGTVVLVLSGDESDARVREVINAGATCYLRKGTPRAEITRAVRESVAAVRSEAADRPGRIQDAPPPGQT